MKTKLLFITFTLALPISFLNAETDCDHAKKTGTTNLTKVVESESQEDEIVIDRSKRTNPYPARTFTERSSANEASRYRTDQGWSRQRAGFWYGSRGSDIPTSGYSK